MNLIQEMPSKIAQKIRWVLTDIDDTMTQDGKLVPEAYEALCRLGLAGLPVIAVTGRSAAWGSVHVQEWPILGAITENGAIAYHVNGSMLKGSCESNTHPSLQKALAKALATVPRARIASDTYLRLYDIAIDYAEKVNPPLSNEEVSCIISIFEKEACTARPSSIHINCWKGETDKKKAAIQFLEKFEGYKAEDDVSKVLYIGDALNDESMFEHFPNACAVANIHSVLDKMVFHPRWVSQKSYGFGFAEIVDVLLKLRVC